MQAHLDVVPVEITVFCRIRAVAVAVAMRKYLGKARHKKLDAGNLGTGKGIGIVRIGKTPQIHVDDCFAVDTFYFAGGQGTSGDQQRKQAKQDNDRAGSSILVHALRRMLFVVEPARTNYQASK